MEDGRIPRAIGEQKMEDELRKCVFDLSRAGDEPLVQFLYIITDKLFLMMIRPPVIAGRVGESDRFIYDRAVVNPVAMENL